MMIIADFLIIGGGVVGLSIARELKSRFVDSRVALMAKYVCDKIAAHTARR